MKKLKPYLVKFNKDGIMKKNNYPINCIVNNCNCQLVIVIIYDKYIFFTDDRIYKS